MRVLYAIQGTGNGHLSRAREIIPLLNRKCHTDILVSGYQADVELPFEVRYRMHGLSFIFGKKGSVDIAKTYSKAHFKRLLDEIRNCPVEDYDFVINDFEPVSAWACSRRKVPCISFSHQASLLDKNVPKPSSSDAFGKFILKHYAPSNAQIGLHFSRYSKDIYTPVIRREIRDAENTDKGHYTVYLPAYRTELLTEVFSKIDSVRWEVFSKHDHEPFTSGNVQVRPVTNDQFVISMLSSHGVLCGAGFETPAEAMFLGKKLMVVPMLNQYEQQCNAAALQAIGVPVIRKLKPASVEQIAEWVASDYKIEINYPDETEKIITRIFAMYVDGILQKASWKKGLSFSSFRKAVSDLIPL